MPYDYDEKMEIMNAKGSDLSEYSSGRSRSNSKIEESLISDP